MFYRFATKDILEDLDFSPAIGIIGPRQVGKTTLAKYIQKKLTCESLYLDLELDSDRRRLDDAETFLATRQDNCIIIDEVQRMPELFPLLRALIDQNKETLLSDFKFFPDRSRKLAAGRHRRLLRR